MYYYIVDASQISQRQYERVQHELHSFISDYHISGEIVRTTGIRTIHQLVETAFFHQANTIVAVGTDKTLDDIINYVGDRSAILGYIPLVKSGLADALGIPDVPLACKALALRRTENIDLGVANGKNFLTRLDFGPQNPTRGFDFFGLLPRTSDIPVFEVTFRGNKYNGKSEIISGSIVNCPQDAQADAAQPTDGLLDVMFLPKLTRWQFSYHKADIKSGHLEKIPGASIMHLDYLEITQPVGTPVYSGGSEFATLPLKLAVKPGALKMIVGRTRTF